MIGRWIDGMMRSYEDARDGAYEALFEPTLRLGVTGLSRAGKTVFITSTIANLLERGRLTGLSAQADGRIDAVALRPQPDRGVPRFDYETHIGNLSRSNPVWPESTRAVAQLRLSIRHRTKGFFSGLAGPSTLHLDIVDYPGEWLLDLTLLDKDFATWSAEVLETARTPLRREFSAEWLAMLEGLDPDSPHDEAAARALSEAYTRFLRAAKADGLSRLTPGRFLMPGELDGSPALTFTPLPPGRGRRGSMRAEFERRYEAYRATVVKPFFRDHFSKVERQIVIVDLLTALDRGPAALADLRAAMVEILRCFRPGTNSWLGAILGAKRVDRVLFAAAKADHVHHTQHKRMTGILQALLQESVERAAFRGADTEAIAIAGVRATVEQEVRQNGDVFPCVRGRLLKTGKEAALFPGDLPDNPKQVLAEAREDAEDEGWLDGDLGVMQFAPPKPGGRAGEGPPHIRLDRALEFLIGDHLA